MKYFKLLPILIILIAYSCTSDGIRIPEVQEQTDTEETEGNQTNNEGENSGDDSVSIVNGIKIGPNYIVFEPEVTNSDLGNWVVRKEGEAKYYPDSDSFISTTGSIPAINDSYLEFTGNNLNGGAANSPLNYSFKCPKTAKYRMVMRMLQPLETCTPGTADCTDQGYEKGDKRNDLWFKLQGDFTSASSFSTEDLKKNHKFWGRGVRKWGSIHKMEGHINGNKTHSDVIVNLKKDEEYTLTISGRAQGCSIDFIVFYEYALEQNGDFKVDIHTDLAEELPEYLRPDILD